MSNSFQHIDEAECLLFADAVELVGRRWSPSILLALARGASRFSEIRASVPGLSDRMLAQRLRELTTEGLVERTVLPSTPVQVRYSLSDLGADLLRALQPLVDWGLRRAQHEMLPVADAG